MQQRYLVCSDLHIPYHDPSHVELMLSVAEGAGIDTLLINGDFLDGYNLNMHGPKDPNVHTSLEEEYAAGRDMLKQFQKRLPKVKMVLLGGNHEWRLDRFVIKNCKAFHNILTTEKMLDLERLGIEWYEYQHPYQLAESLYVMHSPPSYSVNAARTSMMKKLGASFIYGCTHRMDFSTLPQFDGSTIEVYMNGWLGSADLTDEHKTVFSYAKGHQTWTSSFCIVDVIGGEHFVQQIQIKNNKCAFGDSLYEI